MSDTKPRDPLAHLRLLTIKEVCALTRYTPQHIYRLMRAGKFPQRVRIGANRVGWRLAEIETWIAERPVINARRMDDGLHAGL